MYVQVGLSGSQTQAFVCILMPGLGKMMSHLHSKESVGSLVLLPSLGAADKKEMWLVMRNDEF